MSKKLNLKLIALFVIAVGLLVAVTSSKAYAEDCEAVYGGGEKCIVNKSFRITKEVREKGEDDDDAEDKINVDKGEEFVFVITIKNTGEVEVDDMKMKDFLPDELKLIKGDLTEEWNNFDSGDKKTFHLTVKVKDLEFERDNFEKCIVNKAEVRKDGDFEGADTATVCYKKGEISELPETGATAGIALSGLGTGLTAFGVLIRKKFNA